MSKLILSPSKCIEALRKALQAGVSPEMKVWGESKDITKLGSKENRLFFNIEGDVSLGLVSTEDLVDTYQYQGNGSILFYQSYFSSGDSASLELEEQIFLETEEGHTASIAINPNFTPQFSQELDYRGYFITLPFTFYLEIKEKRDSVGYLRDFEFTILREENA